MSTTDRGDPPTEGNSPPQAWTRPLPDGDTARLRLRLRHFLDRWYRDWRERGDN